jgi:hypothetical protein
MKWHREIDYHGSRTYEPAGRGSGWGARHHAPRGRILRGENGSAAAASTSVLMGEG